MARVTGLLGIGAVFAVSLGWLALFFGPPSGDGWLLVAAGCLAGIAGIVTAGFAFSRSVEREWFARIGLGLSMLALVVSVLVVVVVVLLILVVVSGARQGG